MNDGAELLEPTTKETDPAESGPDGSYAPQPDLNDSYITPELARGRYRRDQLGIIDRGAAVPTQYGLALSGGGIRSATFNLGVLQALSTAPPRREATIAGQINASVGASQSLLAQFDYVSSVSGGGYIASFFGSLFVKGRLDTDMAGRATPEADLATAVQAYKVFQQEPPGRLHSDVKFSVDRPGEAPLAWLRENGRYMTPTGSGDLVYAIALAIRNWFAVHYVLGTLFLALFALLTCLRAGALVLAGYFNIWGVDWYRTLEMPPSNSTQLWWSPVWIVCFLLTFLWLAPCGAAFWLTQPRKNETTGDKPHLSIASVATFAIGILFAALAYWRIPGDREWELVRAIVGGCAALALLACVWFWATMPKAESISKHRVRLTRGLAKGLTCLAVLAAIALVDTLAQSIYIFQVARPDSPTWMSLVGITGGLAWLGRKLVPFAMKVDLDNVKAKIPPSLLLPALGVSLLLLVAIIWRMVVLWLQWRGSMPYAATAWGISFQIALYTFGVAALLSVICGMFPGFLNLSTLQGLYSARLTRAYLGASNGKRFNGQAAVKARSAAEPIQNDHVDYQTYFSNPCAPIHLINICLNQNVDPAEQLVQRDRKGRPLVVLPPAGDRPDLTRFAIDGKFGPNGEDVKEQDQLGIGDWVGVSGAAFSTGLGRQTRIGTSIVMALCNVRLGRWWRSGNSTDTPTKATTPFRGVFKTQAYLLDEMFAQFYGTRRPYHYLSDGGHFDNTGVYELLRDKRNVRLIVACDCGADPDYQFEDLANLIRLARIDFGIELVVDEAAAQDEILKSVFGKPSDFCRGNLGDGPRTKCAVMLNVYHPKGTGPEGEHLGDKPDARIILLKPNAIDSCAADLNQYRSTSKAFPQEPTSDQFYDEAQWESYRKLGNEIAKRVFIGVGDEDQIAAYRLRLWTRLADTRSFAIN